MIRQFVLPTAAVLAVATVLLAPSSTPAAPAAAPLLDFKAIYDERFAALMASPRGELAVYSPLERVAGARSARPLPVATPGQRTLAPATLAAARDYAGRAGSSAFMVWRNGRIETEDYFGRSRSDTIVSKSLAKPLTAIAVGRAIALGKIKSLDQSVADFIPEWRGTPRAEMKIRHLLDMRSGLLAQGFSRDPANHWSRAYLSADHDRYIVENYPLTDAPGTIYEYSNATSELVAPVIEAATGMRYAKFIGREILAPIGAAGGQIWVNRPGGMAHAGCCILLPPETWLRLAVLLLQDGRWQGRALLPVGYVAEMRTGTVQNRNYGLGLWLGTPWLERRSFTNAARPGPRILQSEAYLAPDVFSFDGNGSQVVWMIPSANMVVLRTGDAPPPQPEWDNAVLPNTLLRGLKATGSR